MLRRACGFALANKGQDTRALQAYLGHKNIQHTVRDTELSPDRFKDFLKVTNESTSKRSGARLLRHEGTIALGSQLPPGLRRVSWRSI
jgi:hypothetical protein